jgi:MFS family permease
MVRYRYKVGALLFLLAVITYLDRVCISVAGPRIQEYLHIGPQQWGWVVGVFAIAYAVFEIPADGWPTASALVSSSPGLFCGGRRLPRSLAQFPVSRFSY